MTAVVNTDDRPKWLGYVLHGVSALLTLAFLLTGGSKLMGAEMHVQNFQIWGYPGWFMYVTGTVEVLGAILVIIPKTRFYGAALLVATMIGAIITHIQAGQIPIIPVPLVLLLLAGFVAWNNKSAIGR